jgi:hypothetical protein
MIVPLERFKKVCDRLAARHMHKMERELFSRFGFLSDRERWRVYGCAAQPWAWAKVAKRLWARGHEIENVPKPEFLR